MLYRHALYGVLAYICLVIGSPVIFMDLLSFQQDSQYLKCQGSRLPLLLSPVYELKL